MAVSSNQEIIFVPTDTSETEVTNLADLELPTLRECGCSPDCPGGLCPDCKNISSIEPCQQ